MKLYAGTAVERPLMSPVLLPARTWSPPGRWMYAIATVVAILVLEASSRASWMTFFIGGMVGVVLLGAWLWQLVPTLVHRRLGLAPREWLQWIVLPLIVIGTHYAFLSPIPFEARLKASRAAMDDVAAQLMADPEAAPGWIGLYPVDRIDRYENGVRFLVWGSGFLDPIGFAYAVDGEPPVVGEDSYQPIGDRWWHWTESW